VLVCWDYGGHKGWPVERHRRCPPVVVLAQEGETVEEEVVGAMRLV
jgi:hypothetical protein